MDFFDFLANSAGEGGRRTRIFGAVVGALLGGGLGWLIGAALIEGSPGLLYGSLGAIIGAGLGALFAFALIVMLLILAVFVIAFLWQTYVGAG